MIKMFGETVGDKISGERWRAGGKKSVTDFRLTVNMREMDFRQIERKFTRPAYTYRLNQNNPFKTAIFLLKVPRLLI